MFSDKPSVPFDSLVHRYAIRDLGFASEGKVAPEIGIDKLGKVGRGREFQLAPVSVIYHC